MRCYAVGRMKWTVNADFAGDLVEIMRGQLKGMDLDVPAHMKPDDVSFRFWTALRRRIRPSPRTIRVARGFVCPADVQVGLGRVRGKFERGEDLTLHLSRRIEKVMSEDPLLYDWDIHHFHLGEVTAQNPRGRSGNILFARVTLDTAYFISVLPHDNWSNLKLFQIVQENWPESLRPLVGIKPGEAVTDDDVATARRKGFQYLPQSPNGVVYMPPGGGYTASGLSADVLSTSDRVFDRLQHLQRAAEGDAVSIARQLQEQGYEPENPMRLCLAVKDNVLYAQERRSAATFRLGGLFE